MGRFGRGNEEADSQQNFYSFAGNRVYIQSGDTKAALNPGSYSVKYDRNNGELYLKQEAAGQADDTLQTTTLTEISGILTTFYNGVINNTFNKAGYKAKFGVLLEGPPGTGKSQNMTILMQDFINLGGIVINVSDYEVLDDHQLGKFLRKINTIQEGLPLMVNFEDLDRVDDYQEVFLTSILDGEQSPHNVIFFATTNFQEEISDRLKRPGRFDFIYTIDQISEEVRLKYIHKKLSDLNLTLSQDKLEEIYSLTQKYNFSEIRTFMAYYGLFGFAPKNVAEKLKSRIYRRDEIDSEGEFSSDPDDLDEEEDEEDNQEGGLPRSIKNMIKSDIRTTN